MNDQQKFVWNFKK